METINNNNNLSTSSILLLCAVTLIAILFIFSLIFVFYNAYENNNNNNNGGMTNQNNNTSSTSDNVNINNSQQSGVTVTHESNTLSDNNKIDISRLLTEKLYFNLMMADKYISDGTVPDWMNEKSITINHTISSILPNYKDDGEEFVKWLKTHPEDVEYNIITAQLENEIPDFGDYYSELLKYISAKKNNNQIEEIMYLNGLRNIINSKITKYTQ